MTLSIAQISLFSEEARYFMGFKRGPSLVVFRILFTGKIHVDSSKTMLSSDKA